MQWQISTKRETFVAEMDNVVRVSNESLHQVEMHDHHSFPDTTSGYVGRVGLKRRSTESEELIIRSGGQKSALS